MTFSDVITLLMTFFILLLTFSTNEPESFDRMKVSLFGFGGSSGFVGDGKGMDNDAILMRTRARSGRVAQDGSMMPPTYTDPDWDSLDKGLRGLEDDEQRKQTTTHRIKQPLRSLISADGELTSKGKSQLKLLAKQMRLRPLQADFVVGSEAHVDDALRLLEHLTKERVSPLSVGSGVAPRHVSKSEVLIILQHQGKFYGKEG